MSYKMRSFSFPLYPYPRYRTPTSEDLAFDFGDDIHDARPEKDIVLVDSPAPYYETIQYSTEPEVQSPAAHVEKVCIILSSSIHALINSFASGRDADATDSSRASSHSPEPQEHR